MEITKPKGSKKWILNVSAKASKTGKRQRLKFDTKTAAEQHRKNLSAVLKSPHLKRYDEKLLETATYYNEAFQLYGFKGLDEACATLLEQVKKQHKPLTLLELITTYKTNRGADWSDGYIQTFEWAKKQVKHLHAKDISELDAEHWAEWLPKWRKAGNYAAKSSNHLRTFLVTVFSLPSAVSVFPVNPISSIPAIKQKKKEVAIAPSREVLAVLTRAETEDPELVPWFAVAFFAGLRPESELGKLDWADINFDENWIRVGFGNKTDTKRFVDLESNLKEWLEPHRKERGRIQQTNHRKRKDKLVKNTITWARDVTRHTYGSNLEAKARAEGKDAKSTVLANMGHSTLQTFEQHYRNARTAKQAKEYWGIVPVVVKT